MIAAILAGLLVAGGITAVAKIRKLQRDVDRALADERESLRRLVEAHSRNYVLSAHVVKVERENDALRRATNHRWQGGVA